MIKQVMNEMTVQEVRKALEVNKDFMKHEDGFLSGRIFRDQVIFKANEMGMSVVEIVAEYLRSNGCKVAA